MEKERNKSPKTTRFQAGWDQDEDRPFSETLKNLPTKSHLVKNDFTNVYIAVKWTFWKISLCFTFTQKGFKVMLDRAQGISLKTHLKLPKQTIKKSIFL